LIHPLPITAFCIPLPNPTPYQEATVVHATAPLSIVLEVLVFFLFCFLNLLPQSLQLLSQSPCRHCPVPQSLHLLLSRSCLHRPPRAAVLALALLAIVYCRSPCSCSSRARAGIGPCRSPCTCSFRGRACTTPCRSPCTCSFRGRGRACTASCRSPCTGPSGARAGRSSPCRSPCTGSSGARARTASVVHVVPFSRSPCTHCCKNRSSSCFWLHCWLRLCTCRCNLYTCTSSLQRIYRIRAVAYIALPALHVHVSGRGDWDGSSCRRQVPLQPRIRGRPCSQKPVPQSSHRLARRPCSQKSVL
jgi:hypothetical protein